MLIAAFAEATGLSRDTIRFYVKEGLLAPAVRTDTGNRYQHFDESQVQRAGLIRLGRALGYTLREIRMFDAEIRQRGVTRERYVQILTERIAKIDAQAAQMRTIKRFLKRKVAWLEAGGVGEEPRFKLLV